MVEIKEFVDNIGKSYTNVVDSLPTVISEALNVFLFALLIALIAVIIYKFYKTLSKKDILELNLQKYNQSEHSGVKKLVAVFFYFIENLIIMPLIIFLWFAGLSLLLLLVASGKDITQVLLLSAAMVASIRLLAYHNTEIAVDLAKLFPFMTLTVFLLAPDALDISSILDPITKIPLLFGSILSFLVLIFVIELILRLFDTVLKLWESSSDEIES